MGILLTMGAALCWSIGSLFLKQASQLSHPIRLLFYESIIGLIFFVPIAFALSDPSSLSSISTRDGFWLLMSVLGSVVVGGTGTFLSLRTLGAGRTAIMECFFVPFTVMIEVVALGVVLTVPQAMGALLVVAATFILAFDRKAVSLTKGQLAFGFGAALIAQLGFATGAVSLKMTSQLLPVWLVMPIRLVMAFLILLPFALLIRARTKTQSKQERRKLGKTLFFGATFTTVLASYFWIKGLETLSASLSSIVLQLSTVFTLLLAALFLREKLTFQKWLSGTLGIMGVALVALTSHG